MQNDFGVFVVVVSPFMHGGELQSKGDKLELMRADARALLRRGKVELDPDALVVDPEDDAEAPAEPVEGETPAAAPKAPRQRKPPKAAA